MEALGVVVNVGQLVLLAAIFIELRFLGARVADHRERIEKLERAA